MTTSPSDTPLAPAAYESPLVKMLAGDPLARWLAQWHFSPYGVAALVAGYGALHSLVLPALFGHLQTNAGIPGALDDWPNLVLILLLVPAVIGFYAWQPSFMQATYAALAGRAGHTRSTAVRAGQLLQILGWRVWFFVAVIIAGVACANEVLKLSTQALVTWQNANGLMIASRLPLRFILFYTVVFLVVRQTVVLFSLNRLFRELAIEVQPLHPDRAGGLRVLGDYVLSNGVLIGVVGLILGMEILRVNANLMLLTAEFYAELALYFLAAPTLFFLFPLYSAHTRMIEAKRKLLAEIAEQFDLEYRALLASLRQDILKLEEVERLDAIQRIYAIAQAAPDWPFDLGVLSRFGAAVLLPVLVPLGVDLLANIFLR